MGTRRWTPIWSPDGSRVDVTDACAADEKASQRAEPGRTACLGIASKILPARTVRTTARASLRTSTRSVGWLRDAFATPSVAPSVIDRNHPPDLDLSR